MELKTRQTKVSKHDKGESQVRKKENLKQDTSMKMKEPGHDENESVCIASLEPDNITCLKVTSQPARLTGTMKENVSWETTPACLDTDNLGRSIGGWVG